MPYEVAWRQPGKLAFVRVYGDFTIEELEQSVHELVSHLDQGEPPIYILADATELEAYPLNIAHLNKAVRPLMQHPALHWIAAVIQSPTTNFFANTVAQLTAAKLASFKTLEQAEAFIAKQQAAYD